MKLNINLKKLITIGAAAVLIAGMFSGCGSKATATTAKKDTKTTTEQKVNLSDADKKQLNDTQKAIEDTTNKVLTLVYSASPANMDNTAAELKKISVDKNKGLDNIGDIETDKDTYKLNNVEIGDTTMEALKDTKTNKEYSNGATVEFTAHYTRNNVRYRESGTVDLAQENGTWGVLLVKFADNETKE